MDLGLQIEKTNVKIRISILERLCVTVFSQNRLFTFLVQICPKMDFGVRILKILVQIWNQHLQGTMCSNFQLRQTTFDFSV